MLYSLVLALLLAQPAADVLQGEWTIDVVDNIKVVTEAPITMTIRATRVFGNASCNSYSGGLAVTGTDVKFDQILTTMKTCDGVRLSQERDFLALLRTVVRYELRPKDTLALITASGKTLVARRKPPTS